MKNESRVLHIGIIGCGIVTDSFHLPSLKFLKNIDVAALSDKDERRLGTVADRFGINRRYTDPLALINDPGIEAVAVCVPPAFQFSLCMSALNAGKHLFVEKPGALSLHDFDTLIRTAGALHLKAFVGFNLRWHTSVQEAKAAIRNGFPGCINSARTTITTTHSTLAPWRRAREQGGGAIIDLGVHHFDLLCYLFDTDMEEVYAKTVSSDIEDESAVVTLIMSNGIMISSIFSSGSADSNEIEIYGDSGSLGFSLYDIGGLEARPCSSPPGGLSLLAVKPAMRIFRAAANAGVLRRGGVFRDSYYRQWAGFADSVIEDREPGCGLEDGKRALGIALSAIESASSGKPVYKGVQKS